MEENKQALEMEDKAVETTDGGFDNVQIVGYCKKCNRETLYDFINGKMACTICKTQS
jgi:hypothetical protein